MKKFKVLITYPLENIKNEILELNDRYPDLLSSIEFDILSAENNHFPTDLSDYHAICTLLEHKITEDFLKKNSHLKIISNYAVGFNNINLDAAIELNILVSNTPDVLTFPTAETAIGLLLNCARGFPKANESIKEGGWQKWEPTLYNSIDLRESTIGIIGLGRIGTTFAELAYKLWGLKIITPMRESLKERSFSFPIEICSMEAFYENADILSLHCPLTTENKEMINTSFIEKMKRPFIFINTARGELHNEEDIYSALRNKKILSVGLDVTNPEPMKLDNPLLHHPNSFITPHIGSATKSARAQMTRICLDNIAHAFLEKPIPNQVPK